MGDAAVNRLAGEGVGVGPLPPGVPSFAMAQLCVLFFLPICFF
jgi:hypothetical protein